MDTLLNILDRMGGAMLMGAILSGIVYLFLAILKDPLEFLERIFPKVINDVIGNILGLIWGALFIFGLMLFFCSPLLAIQDYFSNNPSRGTTLSEIVLWVYHGFVSYGAGSFWSGVYTVVVSAGTFVGSIAAFVPVLSFCWKKVRGVSNVQKRSEK